MSKIEQERTSAQLKQSTISSRLAELELKQQNADTDNAELRRDKILLVDHVTELQKKVNICSPSHIYPMEMQMLCSVLSSLCFFV